MMKCLPCPVGMIVSFEIAVLRDPFFIETHEIMEIEM